MKLYFRNYQNRCWKIVICISLIILAGLLSVALFSDKIKSINGQLNTYDSSDYEYVYILNYSTGNMKEMRYPDADIQLFSGLNQNTRVAVSLLMLSIGDEIDGRCLDWNEIVIAKNIADQYGIGIGDILFAEFPYSLELIELVVVGIGQYDYDITNPNLTNNVGMGYIGFNEKYSETIKGKYVIFSQDSIADELSFYPQIINSIVTKSANRQLVIQQGVIIFILESLFLICAVALALWLFIVPSYRSLTLFYKKGIKHIYVYIVPMIESIVVILFPCIICSVVISIMFSPVGFFAEILCMIPLIVGGGSVIYIIFRSILLSIRK